MSRIRTAKPVLAGDTKRRIRDYVASRDGRRCHYCARPFGPDLAGATLDHYVPYCLWPMNRPRNLVLACGPCNNAKADHLPLTLALILAAHTQAVNTVSAHGVHGVSRTVRTAAHGEPLTSVTTHVTPRAYGVRTADPHTPHGLCADNPHTPHERTVSTVSAHGSDAVSGPVNTMSVFMNTPDSAGANQRDDPRHTPSTDPTDRTVLRLVGPGGRRVDPPDVHPTSTHAPVTVTIAVLRLLARLAHARLSTPHPGEQSPLHQPIPLASTPTDREVAA